MLTSSPTPYPTPTSQPPHLTLHPLLIPTPYPPLHTLPSTHLSSAHYTLICRIRAELKEVADPRDTRSKFRHSFKTLLLLLCLWGGCGSLPLRRSHERRTVTKAVKFSNTVTEFPDYSRFDDDNRTVVPKITGQHNKYSTGHTAAVNHSSPAHSVPGHSNLGQHSDRSMPDGESGHGKNDISRKSSGDK